jgi:hypothetical protein
MALYDPRGTKLEVGQKVAFNQSGSIAVGYITKLHEGMTKPREYRTYGGGIGRQAGRPTQMITIDNRSKVRSSQNCLVLFEDMPQPTPEDYEVD